VDALQEIASLPMWPSVEKYPPATVTTTTPINANDALVYPVAPLTEGFPTLQGATRFDETSYTLIVDTASTTSGEVSTSPVTDAGEFPLPGVNEMQCFDPVFALPVSWELGMDPMQSVCDEFLRSELFDDEYDSSSTSTNLEMDFQDFVNTNIFENES
jgi:hypothetical protein